MSRKVTMIMVLLLIVTAPSITAFPQGNAMSWPNRTDVDVMTFNFRTALAYEGFKIWNLWPIRKDLVVHVIKEEAPDLIAIQEATPLQIWGVMRALPGYQVVTSGIGDQWKGYPIIFYRKDRFTASGAEGLFFSEAPQIAESVSWGNKNPRCFTTIQLYDRFEKKNLAFVSTHFDHLSANSRLESALLLESWVMANRSKPIIIAGDFNEPAHSRELDTLRSVKVSTFDNFGQLEDSYLLAHEPEKGTLHGFTGRARVRTDLILVSSEWKVRESHVVEYHQGFIYPSDHYPVVATLSYPNIPKIITAVNRTPAKH